MKLHSKRSDDITGELVDVGFDSYRARGHAARNSRAAKRHQPVEDLMVRWRAELADDRDHRRRHGRGVAGGVSAIASPRTSTPATSSALVEELLGPDGRLAERKVFSRRDVLVAAAPHLFGHTPDVLDQVADRVLADPAAIPLVGVPGAKEPAYAPACVIAIEHAIEAVVERGRHHAGFARVSTRRPSADDRHETRPWARCRAHRRSAASRTPGSPDPATASTW